MRRCQTIFCSLAVTWLVAIAPALGAALAPEQTFDPTLPAQPPAAAAVVADTVEIDGGPVTHQFDMATNQTIALIDATTNMCVTGGGFVSRAWDIEPLELIPTLNGQLSVRLDETEIPPNPGFPIVNVLLYDAPRNPGDFCLGVLDTASRTLNSVFDGALQQPGETYVFRNPQTGDPITLQAGQSYYLYAHVSASLSTGPANVTFMLTTPAAPAPALSVWVMMALALALLAGGMLILRTGSAAR